MTDVPGQPGPQQPDDLPAQRPSTIEYSFWAAVLSPVIGLVAVAVELFGGLAGNAGQAFVSQMHQQLEAQGQGGQFGPEQLQTMLRVGIVVVLVFLVVIAALWIMFALFMRGGRNWARVVLTVVGAIWLLTTIPRLFGPDVVLDLLYALQLLAIVGTLVFAYLAPSNQYFQAVARRR